MTKIVLLSVDAIKGGQDTIRKSLIKLDQLIHDNAVQCLLHASVHGDTSLMRRLLVDIVDEKSGYRRQGLISWMRKHSPMELKGKDINLSGIVNSEAQVKAMIEMFPNTDAKLFKVGERRPFLVEEAAAAPFTTDSANREVVRPLFQATILSPVFAAQKKFTAAIENTANGQPIDASKPFYDGVHGDKVADAMDKIKAILDGLPVDATNELRAAQQRIKLDTEFVHAIETPIKTDQGHDVMAPEVAAEKQVVNG